MTAATTVVTGTNPIIVDENVPFEPLAKHTNTTFLENVKKYGTRLFRVSVPDIYNAYLSAYPEGAIRKSYDCMGCRSFLNNLGSAVFLTDEGKIIPACWDPTTAPEYFRENVQNIYDAITRRAWVTEVLEFPELSAIDTLTARDEMYVVREGSSTFQAPYITIGRRQSVVNNKEGYIGPVTFNHFHVTMPDEEYTALTDVWRGQRTSPRQWPQLIKVAKTQLGLYKPNTLRAALNVVGDADGLNNSFRERIQLYIDIHTKYHALVKSDDIAGANNYLWSLVGKVSQDILLIKGTVIGQIFENIEEFGMDIAILRFQDQTRGENYMRTDREPTAEEIKRCQKAYEDLGYTKRDLIRRLVDLEEIEQYALWKPHAEAIVTPNTDDEDEGEMFANILGKKIAEKEGTEPFKKWVDPKKQPVSLASFIGDILPTAQKIRYRLPSAAQWGWVSTHKYDDAKPLLLWDEEDRRNPFHFTMWAEPQPTSLLGLIYDPTGHAEVKMFLTHPSKWTDNKYSNLGQGRYMLALESQNCNQESSTDWFAQHMKRSVYDHRGVIEYSNRHTTLSGTGHSRPWFLELCVGLDFIVETDNKITTYNIATVR